MLVEHCVAVRDRLICWRSHVIAVVPDHTPVGTVRRSVAAVHPAVALVLVARCDDGVACVLVVVPGAAADVSFLVVSAVLPFLVVVAHSLLVLAVDC